MTDNALLRAMAWERAKGELRSMLFTYAPDNYDTFQKVDKIFNQFISDIEDFGHHE
jgi:hypothetical protein